MSSFVDIYRGPALVSLAYLLVYYALMLNVLRVKSRLSREYAARNERFDRYFNTDRHMLAADRMQLNMLEHMPMFLLALWLSAACATPLRATVVGFVYVLARAIYPFLVGERLGRGIRQRVLLATVTSYIALAFLAGDAAWACLEPLFLG